MFTLIMTITEPATMITDYILGAAGLTLGVSLWRITGANVAKRLWAIGFLVSAAAAFAGGTYHGFALHFSQAAHRSLWNVTVGLIGATAAFMISAALARPLNRKARNTRWLLTGLAISLAGLAVQQSHLSFHTHFNHNDLYHCIQTVALFCFYEGARQTD